MLVFVDESGDTGLNIAAGASGSFIVALIIFEDHAQAHAADERITLLRQELNKPAGFEFHFKENSDAVRQAFLEAILPFEFYYVGLAVSKSDMYQGAFPNANAFYNWTCGTVFEIARPLLDNAIVKIDKSSGREFQRELASYLRQRINDPKAAARHINKVVMEDSKTDSLLQLADMVCGAVARSYRTDKKNPDRFRKIITHREISVRLWPN